MAVIASPGYATVQYGQIRVIFIQAPLVFFCFSNLTRCGNLETSPGLILSESHLAETISPEIQ